MSEKRYIGDSVYVEWDGYLFVLTTENGLEASNTICLEREVLAALIEYAKETLSSIERVKPSG